MEWRITLRDEVSYSLYQPGTVDTANALRAGRKGNLPPVPALVRRPEIHEGKKSWADPA